MSLTEFLHIVEDHEVVKVVNMSAIGAARILCDEKDVWLAYQIPHEFYTDLYEVYMVTTTKSGNICVYVEEYELKEE